MKPFFFVDFICASKRWRISSFLRSRSSNLAFASSDYCTIFWFDEEKLFNKFNYFVWLKTSKKHFNSFYIFSSFSTKYD